MKNKKQVIQVPLVKEKSPDCRKCSFIYFCDADGKCDFHFEENCQIENLETKNSQELF